MSSLSVIYQLILAVKWMSRLWPGPMDVISACFVCTQMPLAKWVHINPDLQHPLHHHHKCLDCWGCLIHISLPILKYVDIVIEFNGQKTIHISIVHHAINCVHS